MAALLGWDRTIQARDGLSHIFHAQVLVSPSLIGDLVSTAGVRPTPSAKTPAKPPPAGTNQQPHGAGQAGASPAPGPPSHSTGNASTTSQGATSPPPPGGSVVKAVSTGLSNLLSYLLGR
jgi:hypothetical protein